MNYRNYFFDDQMDVFEERIKKEVEKKKKKELKEQQRLEAVKAIEKITESVNVFSDYNDTICSKLDNTEERIAALEKRVAEAPVKDSKPKRRIVVKF